MANKKVLISAGAAGIGRAMAEAFASETAQVWVVDIDQATLATCPSQWQRTALDTSDENAVITLFEHIRSEWGSLDVLCANTGIAGPIALVENIALEDWQRCVSVSLESAFLFAKYSAPLMKTQRSGVMLLTSSTAGLYGYSHRAPYVAAKWAVIGLMKTLAIELGPFNIRANAICPGPVEGPRMETVLQHEAAAKGTSRDVIYQAYAAGSSMQRWITAADIANMALFLASDAARLVSGQVIAVDGHTENPDPKI